MKTLVCGASGATGRHLVEQLIQRGQHVKAIVRAPEQLPVSWHDNTQLTVIQANIAECSVDEMAGYLKDCGAVASCLGHNITLQGVFGQPRKLVADAVKLLCNAIEANRPAQPVKFVLMSSVGIRNPDAHESISRSQQAVIWLMRALVPPQSDNEKAAGYLRSMDKQMDPAIEWVVVRPDSLQNDETVTEYELHPSPIRSAIFNPGKTSRINVGHFMSELITDDQLWNEWKGQMPAIYNIGNGRQ